MHKLTGALSLRTGVAPAPAAAVAGAVAGAGAARTFVVASRLRSHLFKPLLLNISK